MARHRDWIEAHKDYPHEDWCLVWPFAREKRTGRGQIGLEGGGHDWAHRVMCEAVHGPAPPDKPQASHSCGNGHEGCINPRHLDWASNSENQRIRYAQGRVNPNANGNISMFTPEQIAEIQSLYGQMTQMEIAARFGCSLGTVQYYLKYREQRGHAGAKIKHWAPDEEKLLERLLVNEKCTYPEAAKIIGRDAQSVAGKARRMGLKSGYQMTKITDRPGFSFPNGERNGDR